MRLKSVYISKYKNLEEFTLNFDNNNFIDIFVGKNGSGKSNFFEALIEIFKFIYEFDKKNISIGFDFYVLYEIDNKTTKIEWKAEELLINGNSRKGIGSTPIPDNVIVYYTGHNETVGEIINTYQERFSKRIKSAKFDESRRFIGIGSEYKRLILGVMLLQPDENKARQYICKSLGIESEIKQIQLTLKRPVFAKKDFIIDHFEENTHFWGTEGVMKEFLKGLTLSIFEEFTHYDIYDQTTDTYKLNIDRETFSSVFGNTTPPEIFRLFDNLETLGMIDSIHYAGETISGYLDQFSDGQFQSVYIYSIIELFKDRNCITLLDEPDSFLHPEWQFEFLKQVLELTDDNSAKNHVLLSSHSASTITTAKDDIISLFEINGNKVKVSKACKSNVINSLSAGLIALTDNEAQLNITQTLSATNGTVLFTEGITDEIIITHAWEKLFPSLDCPFIVQNAFDRIFLRNLFSRDELKVNYPNRYMFALFDFDEAYDDWNGLKYTQHECTDPFEGLCKQLRYAYHYAILIPILNDPDLKPQALKSDDTPWGRGSDSHIAIEHLFYKCTSCSEWFTTEETSCGGSRILFTGDKSMFASEVVPQLDAEHFEVFRPMFEFIKKKCQ